VIVGAVFIADFLASGVGGFMVPLFFKPMTEEMGWSLTLLTGVLTAQTIANAAVSPILGPLVDRLGAKPVMVWGAVVAGLGLIALTRITEVWHFWVLYAAVGALGLNEMGGLTGPVLISKWFVRRRGKALSLATLGTTAGGAVMAPILGFLIAGIGWRDTLGVMGIMLIVIMVPVALLFVRRQPEDMGLLPDGDPDAAAGPAGRSGNRRPAAAEESWTVKEAMRTRTLWMLIISLNLIQLASSAIVFQLVPFLTLQEGMSAQAAGMVLTARLVVATFSRLLWGFAADRFSIHSCLAFAFFSRALGPISLVVLPYPANVIAMLVSNIAGGGFQVLQPMAFANYYGRKHQGAIQGLTRPFLTVSSLVGPLIISFAFDLTGTFDPVFMASSVLGVVSAGVAYLAVKPVKRGAAVSAPEPAAPK
jgi:MFS family permease